VPEERALAAAERALESHDVETVDLRAARERLAKAGSEVETLREQVATKRGRLEARRETGADTAAAEEALADATARLSEAETERLAAEQAHDAAQRRAREARTARERRLRLEDRVANRRRDARRALVSELAEAFPAAVDSVPGAARLSLEPLGVEGDPVTAALAAARLAELRAPVVDDTGRFAAATIAVERLGTPVIRC
jgi:chromosome segregation ATPase